MKRPPDHPGPMVFGPCAARSSVHSTTGVLTSEQAQPAPVVDKEKTEPPPKPDEVAIPKKITKPVK